MGHQGRNQDWPRHGLQCCHAHRSERETAVRISQEIGNLMKEIETLVEEKTKESLDVSRLTREGEPAASGMPMFTRWQHPQAHRIPASAWVAGARTSSTFNPPRSCHPDSPENEPLAQSKIPVSQLA